MTGERFELPIDIGIEKQKIEFQKTFLNMIKKMKLIIIMILTYKEYLILFYYVIMQHTMLWIIQEKEI